MKKLNAHININDCKGTGQKERHSATLNPLYFQADEKQLNDFVDFAVNYSTNLSYYNLSGKPEGDWKDFFQNDIILI